jgi:sarcosine oxidase, subunit gamma
VFGAPGTTKQFGRVGLAGGPFGVGATLRRSIAMAQLTAKPNQSAALATRIADRIGITLPLPGRRLVAGHLSFLATQPGAWLACADDEDGALFAQQLTDDLSAYADVTDLTTEMSIIDIVGPRSRDLLALGLELDTEPAVWPAGHCTRAALGRMVLTVSCVETGKAFQLVIGNSELPDLASWLAASASEFGLETMA